LNDYRQIVSRLESNPELLTAVELSSKPDDNGDMPIDGASLMREVESFISSFVILPPNTVLTITLWVFGTYIFKVFETFPYLAFLSPQKGCGKTRTTEVIELIASNPVRAVSASEAALFRLIDAESPTLILDEAENLTGRGDRAEYTRALLNAGNRSGAKVPRCVGSAQEVRMFNVYCPKIVSAIRVCPETIRDRSVVIPMQRKRRDEKVARLLLRKVHPLAKALRERIIAWTDLNRAPIVKVYEHIDIDMLNDRDLENFEPLLAILTVADPSRLDEVKKDAELLTSDKTDAAQDESHSLRLLADIREIFKVGQEKILSADLLARLRSVDESPWAAEIELDPRKLSWMLRPYQIKPKTVRVGNARAKGYERADFLDAFARYLRPDP
jgi:Protein of unknown function (DUF3631)